jgi:site-specific DNA recombinase
VQARLIQDPNLTVHDVARDEKVSSAHLYTNLRLAWLAPDIIASIVNGRRPPQLNAKSLLRLIPRLPANWAEQRKLLDFR